MAAPVIPPQDLQSFTDHLRQSNRILALCGAGLSAASGLPTFRGAGGLWRTYDAVSLATPQAFRANPGLVWQFYGYRRHMALQVKPNAAHYALAELARRRAGFRTLTQNVDGLSPRAGHPPASLHLLHGSLFDIKCFSRSCKYFESNNYTDPFIPALAIPTKEPVPAPLGTATTVAGVTDSSVSREASIGHPQLLSQELDISDDRVEIPELSPTDLPSCPLCHNGLLRPGVVWFGEALPQKTLQDIDDFIDASKKIDLIIVIGTSGVVYPAAGYVEIARNKGAKVAVVNMDEDDVPGLGDERKTVDWFFQGDASVILPQILHGEIGDPAGYVPE